MPGGHSSRPKTPHLRLRRRPSDSARTRPRSVHPSRTPGKPKDAFLAPSRVEAPSVCGLGDDLTCFATTFWSGLGDHLTLELCDWRRVSLRGLSRESAADDACSLRTQRRCRCCLLPRPHLDNGSPVDRHSGGWKQPRACGRRPVLRAICGCHDGFPKAADWSAPGDTMRHLRFSRLKQCARRTQDR